jgi:hypothetical protein
MNQRRKPRSYGRVAGAPRIRPVRATSPSTRADHRRPETSSPDGAVLSLLSELLIGDSAWTMAEVQRLVAVRDLAELGRWRAAGLDDVGTSGP